MKNVICVLALMMVSVLMRGQFINFPDANFKNALVNTKCVDINEDGVPDKNVDANQDGKVSVDEAEGINNLILDDKYIVSLNGIENFIKLKILKCSKNNLTILNLSNLDSLIKIDCSYNQISQIAISKLSELKTFICANNNLTQITFSSLPSLADLNCSNNKISTIRLSDLTSLRYLNLSNNLITELPLSNLHALYALNCSFNKIINLLLSDLPSLYDINCKANLITQIVLSNLPALYNVDYSYNQITEISFSNLPQLFSLDVSNNMMTEISLFNLQNIKYINCNNNYLNKLSIQNLPVLEHIVCNENQLTQLILENLPSLIFIDYSYNKLKKLTLFNLPMLKSIYGDFNQLTQLTILDLPSLEYLNCSSNQLEELDISSLNSLKSIYLEGNPLYVLLSKFENTNNLLDFSFPNSIKYVCTNEINIDWFKSKLPNAIINSYCSFTPGGKFYSILGNTIFDQTHDGCNSVDFSYPNLKFSISSNNVTGSLLSNQSGGYFIHVKEGTHNIKPILENPNYFTVSPDSITVTFPSTSDTIIQNFCITPKNIHKQIDLSIIPLTPPARPGFNAQYKVVMTNKGNQVENGTLNFNYDEARLDFVTTDVTPTSQTDGWLTWDFKDLLPFETRYYIVTLNVNTPSETSPVNAGDELIINCSILDNVFSLKQTVVGSYDPNDKTCLEGNKITPEQVGKYIHYLIRFENTGNYAAENIVVKDVIDESTFDLSSLQITDASHKAWARINNNIVEFIFENIQLPFDDANNDGYIAFKIKTKPSLQLGNELKNEANIYFDYNKPILTNKTNTVVAIPDATDEALGSSEIEVFPNPVNDVLKFNTDEKIHKLEIYDVSGRLVQVSSVVSNEVNVEGLAKGSYVMKIRSGERVRVGKMVKM